MKKEHFLMKMHFPIEWITFNLYPDVLFKNQINLYREDNDEESSEHYRNGAFHWWIRRNPDKDTLIKLINLTFLDLEQLMADDVRSYIIKCEAFDNDLKELMKESYISRLYSIASMRDNS
ncbi:hypothetical protein [Lelliottia wanjuensis]|uniref:Uncharacterized protein n=1 Tax=Lelliottia wanjuensis TaxID=3050585 RepID=A0AAP4D3Q7_9ENTR|nr:MULTISPECIES: hypothetical protein [unclassified Lelliottia]MDK9363398.1 hypothetical protein [Lelliottia sp. V106_12]MDK9585530.1 hypothetical protein [Lelliottia sp. V86_10]MDK9617040.1 hypothetical protein [Lelliottia sp. V106_9]